MKKTIIRTSEMNKNRIVLILVVIVVVVLIGVLLGAFIPSMMQTILDMHRGS